MADREENKNANITETSYDTHYTSSIRNNHMVQSYNKHHFLDKNDKNKNVFNYNMMANSEINESSNYDR